MSDLHSPDPESDPLQDESPRHDIYGVSPSRPSSPVSHHPLLSVWFGRKGVGVTSVSRGRLPEIPYVVPDLSVTEMGGWDLNYYRIFP